MADEPDAVSPTLVLAADWDDPGSWNEPLLCFVRSFPAEDAVRLVLPFEPEHFDGEALAAEIARLAASAGLDLERCAELVLAPVTEADEYPRLAAGALALLVAPGRAAPGWANGLPIRVSRIASREDLAGLVRPLDVLG